MNIDYYNEISPRCAGDLYAYFSDSENQQKKKLEDYKLVKEVLIDELRKRKLVYDENAVDIYPTCIKVEKETLEFPLYREAIEAVRGKVKRDYDINLDLFSF